MKNYLLPTCLFVAACVLVWFIWFRAAPEVQEAGRVVTEVPVKVAEVKRGTVRRLLTLYGTVQPEPAGEKPGASAQVASAVAGLVNEVRCREGEQVAQGATLFVLDSRAADVAVEKARQAVEFAETVLNRQKKLLEVEGTSQRTWQEAEAALAAARNEYSGAQTQQSLLRITAPLAGTITRIHVRPGEAIDLTKPLAEIIDLNRLVVSANVPSLELARVQPGQSADIYLNDDKKPLVGSLTFISSIVDSATDTAPIRMTLPADSQWRPGQFVRLSLVTEEHRDRLLVPVESVVHDEEGHRVVAVVEENMAHRHPVTTGLQEADQIEIQGEGLEEGMKVVTAGSYALPEETKVRVIAE